MLIDEIFKGKLKGFIALRNGALGTQISGPDTTNTTDKSGIIYTPDVSSGFSEISSACSPQKANYLELFLLKVTSPYPYLFAKYTDTTFVT